MAVLCEVLTTLGYLCDCLSGTPPHGRFNGIRQVVPVCTPPNTCFLGPTRVHNPNGSHFCTAHGRVSLYFTMGRPLPSKLPLPTGGSGTHLRHGSLGLQPKRRFDRFSRFCRAHYCDGPTDRQTDRRRYWACSSAMRRNNVSEDA